MARPVNRTWLILSFLAGLFVAALVLWFWRGPVAPSPEAQAALTDWLAVGCKVGEGNQFDDALRMFNGELETPLINLFQLGPAKSEISRVERAARRQFESTQSLINSGQAKGLPQSDVDALRNASVDAWVKRAGEEFVDSQRSAALAGLGIVGGSKGRRLLEQIAADPKSPFYEVARLALLGDSPAAQR